MPVTATDVAGSPTGGQDAQGRFGRRVVLVNWSDVDAYCQELIPPTSGIVQQPAASFSATDTNLRVASYTWAPYWGESDRPTNPSDCGTAPPTYTYAKFTIDYRYPTSPQDNSAATSRGDPVPFLEHSVTGGGQLLLLRQDSTATSRWQWEYGQDVPDTEDTPISVMLGTNQHSVFWPRVVTPNWTNLEKFRSTINSGTFKLRGYTYPAETLLYLGYDFGETVMSNGAVAYNVRLNFESKTVQLDDGSFGGHNHFWDKSVSEWIKVVKSDNSAQSPYKTNNFSSLFISA